MDAHTWLQVLEKVGPMLLLLTPAAPAAPFIVAGIHMAEQIPGASGAQKKDFATQIAILGAQATNAIQGRTVIDPANIQVAVSSGIDTVVAITNIAHNHIQSLQPKAA